MFLTCMLCRGCQQASRLLYNDFFAVTTQIKSLLILHKYQPMLIPPLPWRSLDSGGHILTRSFIMRVGNNRVHREALASAQNAAEGGLSQAWPLCCDWRCFCEGQ